MRRPPIRTLAGSLFIAGAFVIILCAAASTLSGRPVPDWLPPNTLSLEKILPLVGLGVALATLPAGWVLAVGLCFVAGYGIGIANYAAWLEQTRNILGADRLMFSTGPLSTICAGLILLAPDRIRPWLSVPGVFVIGSMLAIATKLSDPTLGGSLFISLGIGTGLWAVGGIGLCVHVFYRPWFPIPVRILGSWLLAIGLLYGGTVIFGARNAPPAPVVLSPLDLQGPDLGNGSPMVDDPLGWGQ